MDRAKVYHTMKSAYLALGRDATDEGREAARDGITELLQSREFKEFREQAGAEDVAARYMATRPADIQAMPYKVSPFGPWTDATLTFEVETEEDACALCERLNPIEACTTTKHKGTFYPFAQIEARTKGQSGEPHDFAPWWAKVEDSSFRPVTVHTYSAVNDDATGELVQISVRVRTPSMRVTADRVNYPGGFKYENKRLVDPHNLFVNRVRMWTPDSSMGAYTAY